MQITQEDLESLEQAIKSLEETSDFIHTLKLLNIISKEAWEWFAVQNIDESISFLEELKGKLN